MNLALPTLMEILTMEIETNSTNSTETLMYSPYLLFKYHQNRIINKTETSKILTSSEDSPTNSFILREWTEWQITE